MVGTWKCLLEAEHASIEEGEPCYVPYYLSEGVLAHLVLVDLAQTLLIEE
jgi:hypothetical protein